jgi:type II secretory pathway predicted ATPase ExeA
MVPPALKTTLLNDLARIFAWQPDPAHYFATPATEKLRHGLGRALQGGAPVCVLTGHAGAGKTLLLQTCLADMAGHWAHMAQLSYTSMSGSDILRAVAYAFGMPKDVPAQPLAWTRWQLSQWAALQQASLLVIDEAHSLPQDALQPLLALSRFPAKGRPLLQLLLVGDPTLLGVLAEGATSADASAFALPDFLPRESAAYITHRLGQVAAAGRPVLSADVMAEIHARTQGRPGQINLLCKQLLQTAVLMDSEAAIDVTTVAFEADELGLQAASPAPVEPAPVSAVPAAKPAIEAAPTAPAAPTARAAPAAPIARAAPAAAPAVVIVPAPARKKAWLLPATLSLLLTAVGAAVLLQQPWTASEPPKLASGVVMVPPRPVAAAGTPAPSPAPAPAPTPSVATLPPAQAQLIEPAALSAAPPAPAQHTVSTTPDPSIVPAPRPAVAGKQLAAVPASFSAAVQPPARTRPSGDARCTQLLAQLSLGEPLNAGQQHTLKSTCH